MKIGILTWHKEINHGAILQAYALQKVLEEYHCDVVELDYVFSNELTQINNNFNLKKIIKKININSLSAKFKLNKWITYKKNVFTNFAKNEMNLGLMYNRDQKLDKVIIGSDMVFDFYEGYNSYMYGKDVKCNYIFSYAACFGYTTQKTFDLFEKKNEIISSLKKLKGIGYRDNNTGEILRINCKLNHCVKTIDPVLLYGFTNEKKQWQDHKWSSENYILIYSYTYNMETRKEITCIKKYAKDKNLKIISVGYYHRWCDISINADPKEFVELFANARYIITDTFHGTVFSIIFNKQFLPIVRNNSFKILDLLHDLHLSDIVCENIEKDILKLDKSINYEIVNNELNSLRKKSNDFIVNHINN